MVNHKYIYWSNLLKMKNIKIEINDENIGYYSLYREPEVAYIELNKNRPHFTDSEIERGLKRGLERPFEEFSAADQRCFGVAFARIDKRTKFIKRKKFNKPIILSGEKIERSKYVEGGYLYNRCHLIGCQLHPFKNDEKNFIIGTRYFNMKGMLPFENKVKDYVEKGGCVLYRVKPYFKEKNILAYGVQMEALSIINNRDDRKLHFNVFVYNKQPGITIDYESGESHVDRSWTELENRLNNECDCVYNIKKIHMFDSACQKQTDKEFYPGIGKMLLKHGGTPCKNCYPQGFR